MLLDSIFSISFIVQQCSLFAKMQIPFEKLKETKKNVFKKMVALGFEPRHLSVMGLESIALDHSAKLPLLFTN